MIRRWPDCQVRGGPDICLRMRSLGALLVVLAACGVPEDLEDLTDIDLTPNDCRDEGCNCPGNTTGLRACTEDGRLGPCECPEPCVQPAYDGVSPEPFDWQDDGASLEQLVA